MNNLQNHLRMTDSERMAIARSAIPAASTIEGNKRACFGRVEILDLGHDRKVHGTGEIVTVRNFADVQINAGDLVEVNTCQNEPRITGYGMSWDLMPGGCPDLNLRS